MPVRDLGSAAKVGTSLAPVSVAGAAAANDGADSDGDVDCTGFRWAYIVASVGVTDVVTTVAVEESLDGSGTGGAGLGDWALVDAATTFTFAATDDGTSKVGVIDLHQREDHLRISFSNAAGTSALLAGNIILTADRGTQFNAVSTPEFEII